MIFSIFRLFFPYILAKMKKVFTKTIAFDGVLKKLFKLLHHIKTAKKNRAMLAFWKSRAII